MTIRVVEKTLASPACKTQTTRFARFHRLDYDCEHTCEMLEPPEMAHVAETSFFKI
jgi:hypothetical protein